MLVVPYTTSRPVRTSGRTCSWHRQINVVIGSCGLTHNILLSKMGFVVLYDFTYVSGILNKVFWPLVLVPLGSTVCGSAGQQHTQSFNLEDLFRISVSLEGKADMLVFVLAGGSLMRRDEGFSSWDQNSHHILLFWVRVESNILVLARLQRRESCRRSVTVWNLKMIFVRTVSVVMNPWCCSRQIVFLSEL